MIRAFAKNNSSALLVAGASVGVLSTAYFTAKASFRAAHVFEDKAPDMELKERVGLVWKLYIPAGISGATTIVCIVGLRHVDGAKLAAAQAALGVSTAAFDGYRAQIVEELGEKKDQLFAAKAAEKRIAENPPSTIIAGSGSVMCCELFTGRYFMSDMDSLNRAVNEINSRLNKHDYATLDDFYYIIDLEPTTASSQIGWESGKLLELEFSSVISQGKPCLAFGYNYVKSF